MYTGAGRLRVIAACELVDDARNMGHGMDELGEAEYWTDSELTGVFWNIPTGRDNRYNPRNRERRFLFCRMYQCSFCGLVGRPKYVKQRLFEYLLHLFDDGEFKQAEEIEGGICTKCAWTLRRLNFVAREMDVLAFVARNAKAQMTYAATHGEFRSQKLNDFLRHPDIWCRYDRVRFGHMYNPM